jgi:hypothetical protein
MARNFKDCFAYCSFARFTESVCSTFICRSLTLREIVALQQIAADGCSSQS